MTAPNELRVVNLKVRPLVEVGRVLGHVREIGQGLGLEIVLGLGIRLERGIRLGQGNDLGRNVKEDVPELGQVVIVVVAAVHDLVVVRAHEEAEVAGCGVEINNLLQRRIF